ncbi:GDP-mannose 4,6-dehydratase [candidate division CSSED10-310 bacterium]|uniref:GDP-mannose 4,6-dehydratase n=1 Tax=candidate division CSSED10-310 bacterium TaxID=2855610 RepID=A0ABV6YUV6_UNCC1
MKKVVVIGGAGFIGCHVVAHHLGVDDQVTVIDNLSRKGTDINLQWLEEQPGDFSFFHGDIRIDRDLLEQQCLNADLIYHLAAQVAVTTSVTNPREDFDINALGTFNVLEAARGARSDPILIYASTNKVFGGLEDLEVVVSEKRYQLSGAPLGIDEDRSLDFHSPYGCSKGSGDQYCRDYYRIYGLKTLVFRQSCIYGIRQFGVEDQGWVAHFVISSLFDKPITIYGDGMQVRDVLWIEDLVQAYLKAVTEIDRTAGQVYNIGGGPTHTMSLLDLLDILAEEFGKKIQFSFADWRPGDQKVYISNISRAKKEFGWEPQISPRKGTQLLIAWAQQNRNILSRVFKARFG